MYFVITICCILQLYQRHISLPHTLIFCSMFQFIFVGKSNSVFLLFCSYFKSLCYCSYISQQQHNEKILCPISTEYIYFFFFSGWPHILFDIYSLDALTNVKILYYPLKSICFSLIICSKGTVCLRVRVRDQVTEAVRKLHNFLYVFSLNKMCSFVLRGFFNDIGDGIYSFSKSIDNVKGNS